MDYGELLAQAKPAIIETPEEHERLLTLAEELMDKGPDLAPEERKLLELLVLLIEVFEKQVEEDESEPEPEPEKHVILQRLIAARGWEPDVLNDIFGNPHNVKEALEGRLSITRGQAKALGNLLRVPPKLFH